MQRRQCDPLHPAVKPRLSERERERERMGPQDTAYIPGSQNTAAGVPYINSTIHKQYTTIFLYPTGRGRNRPSAQGTERGVTMFESIHGRVHKSVLGKC